MQRELGENRNRISPWRYVCVYSLLFAALFAIAYGRVFLFGKSFVNTSDGLEQHFAWFVFEGRWLREILSNLLSGNSPIVPEWTYSLGFGADIVTSMSNWIGDPLNLLSVFCPEEKAPYLFTILWIARCWLSGLTFSYYCLRKTLPTWSVLPAAITYSMGGYAIWSFVNPNFFTPLIIFPLVLAGADNLFEEKSPNLLIASSFLAFASWFYFAYMICILLLTYCIITFLNMDRKNPRLFAVLFGKFAGCLMLGAAMAAFLLVPIVSAQLGTSRLSVAHAIPLLYLEDSGLPNYYVNFIGAFIGGSEISVMSCIGFGGLGALSCLALLMNHAKELRALKLWFVALTAFALVPVGGWVLNGFTYASNRWVFGYAFCVCLIIATMLPSLPDFVSKHRKKTVAILAAASALLLAIPITRSIPVAIGIAAAFLLAASAMGWRASDRAFQMVALGCSCALAFGVGISYWNMGYPNNNDNRVPFSQLYASMRDNSVNSVVEAADIPYEERYDKATIGWPVNQALFNNRLSVDFYDNLYSEPVSNFIQQLEITSAGLKESFCYTDLDSRSALEAISGVQAFVIPATREDLLPYGSEQDPMAQASNVSIHKLSRSLPIAFTYKNTISKDDWSSESPVGKQGAFLIGCLVDGSTLQEQGYSTASRSVPYRISESDSASYSEGIVMVSKANASIQLRINGTGNSETYLRIKDLDFAPLGAAETMAISGGNAMLTRYEKSNMLQTALLASKWYGPSYWSSSEFSLHISSSAMNGQRKDEWTFRASTSDYYTGESNWTINCGYSAQPQKEITITFPKPGRYTMDLEVICQPMDDFDAQVAALSEDPVKNLELTTNRISGTVSCSGDRLIYMSIPWAEGWSATLDGQPAEIKRANVAFMAIEASEGDHRFELTYANPKTHLGLLISAIAWVAFVGISVVRWRLQKSAVR